MKQNADFVKYIFYIMVAGVAIWLVWFINQKLGDQGFLAFIFLLFGWLAGFLSAVIGSKLNSQGQNDFIRGLGQLKAIMAPTIRENARTQGMIEREQIRAELRKTDDPDSDLNAFFAEYQ